MNILIKSKMVTFEEMQEDTSLKLAKKYLARVSPARVKRNAIGCKILNYKPTKKNGYIQLFDGNKKGPVCHKVSCLIANGPPPDETYQASHICGNARCFNGDHLCWEDPETNNSRKGCIGFIYVKGTKYRCAECVHSPRCLTAVSVASKVE